MKKINFKKPKYIIPLIFLPFSFIFNFLFLEIFAPTKAQANAKQMVELEDINTALPDANLNKKDINEKFDAGLKEHKYRTDYSAIRELGEDKRGMSEYGSVYTEQEKAMLDSMNAAILSGKQQKSFEDRVKDRQNADRNRYQPAATTASTKKQETTYEKEMRLFKEQMRYIDSLDRASRNPEPIPAARKPEVEKQKEEVEAMAVSKSANPNSSFFNTVKDNNQEQFIKAILDEGLTVRDGGRIRIRLLDDIYVSNYEIKKGTYLYGVVSGFQSQRVEITISSLLHGNQIIPISLSIYDNDGIAGLYVPDSQFRAFTKELAGNATSQSISLGNGVESTNELLFSMLDKMAQTTTRAAGKAIKQNKSKLKYNTVVYLIDNKAKNK